jgi:hypothetical protein
MSAQEQIESARSRVKAARERAQARMNGRRKAANGDFNPVNGGVIFAAFLFVAACAGLSGLVWMARESGRDDSAQVVNDGDGTPNGSYAQFDLPDVPPMPPAVEIENGHVKVGNSQLPSPRIVINGTEVGSAAGVGGDEFGAVSGKKVLVISDVVPSTTSINSAIDRLRSAGFDVIGNIAGVSDDGEHLVELEAAAKGVRGLGQLDAVDVKEHLAGWLSSEEELSLLVWFSRANPERPSIQAYVIAPCQDAEADEETVSAARTAMRAAVTAVSAR